MKVLLDLLSASKRIRSFAWATPIIPVGPPRSATTVLAKAESLQHTGSFKVRGAANRLLKLADRERARGVVAASSGNHGRAVAEVARRLGVSATICVPEWVDSLKLQRIRAAGARVVLATGGYDEAEDRAAALAARDGKALVHPFDDIDVVEGQGTVGLEILRQCPDVEEVLVPLSGGGLASGVGLALRDARVRVVAVSARRASVMMRSLEAGRPLELSDQETVASALSGGIGRPNRLTFDLCNSVVDEHVVVEERDVEDAVARAFRELRLVVEGGGAVGLAALWSGRHRPRGTAVAIVSGGNLDPSILRALAIRPAREP